MKYVLYRVDPDSLERQTPLLGSTIFSLLRLTPSQGSIYNPRCFDGEYWKSASQSVWFALHT